ncbi:MAG: metallo-mystery pair system four-Cys motif protein [Thermoleophilia bacterium]|nr:metallo-mystery pair system four-Cys motif protein [Thermoleophilia bacterium]
MSHRILAGAAIAASLAAAAPAVAATKPKTMPVEIRFAAVAGTTPVSCASEIPGLGTTNAAARLEDLRFFVSNVRMVRANGTSAAVKLTGSTRYNVSSKAGRTTLIDLENGTGSCARSGDMLVNAAVRGRVPRGAYRGVRFYVGVPFGMNHTDVIGAPGPLASMAMAWSWQSGRKFTKIEVGDPGGATGTWTAKSFMVHLGSTGCTGNPATGGTASCAASNRATVKLARFNPARQKVAVDLRAMLSGVDVTRNTPRTAPGCMSGPTDPECPAVFDAFGIDRTTGASMHGGMHQRVFRAIAR